MSIAVQVALVMVVLLVLLLAAGVPIGNQEQPVPVLQSGVLFRQNRNIPVDWNTSVHTRYP